MPEFTMHAREFKTMRDPNRKPDGHTKYVCYLDTATMPQELQDWSNTNPRDQKMTTDVARAIVDSLEERDDFHELNRGLLFSVESVHYDNLTELLSNELTKDYIHGNLEGGNTLRVSLKRFLNQGKESRERILENMRPIIEDIFRLWEAVEREFPQKVKNGKHQYGVKKYSKYNKGEVVGRSLFYQSDLIYLVPKGIVYPVTGAFRALISIDPATGKYAWKKDPLDVWNILGDRLAAIVWYEKEENPEYLGKSRNLWSNLFKEVLLYILV